MHGFANLYFQAGRLYYFAAPVLIGWTMGLTAVAQRAPATWPILGLLFVAWMGGTAQIQASRSAIPQGLGHISMEFGLGHAAQGKWEGLYHAVAILLLTLLPYLVLRLQVFRQSAGR